MNTLVRENRDGDRAQTEQFVAPSASVTEAADGYTLQVEMPGVNKQGLEVLVENNELTIVGRRSLPTDLHRRRFACRSVWAPPSEAGDLGWLRPGSSRLAYFPGGWCGAAGAWI